MLRLQRGVAECLEQVLHSFLACDNFAEVRAVGGNPLAHGVASLLGLGHCCSLICCAYEYSIARLTDLLLLTRTHFLRLSRRRNFQPAASSTARFSLVVRSIMAPTVWCAQCLW